MGMEYKKRMGKVLRQKEGRKRGRPRKEDYIEIEISEGEQVVKSNEEIAAMQRNIDELKAQLAELSGKAAVKEEKVEVLDEDKIRNGSILTQSKKDDLIAMIKKCESMLYEKETTIGKAAGSGGGLAECFVDNKRVDKGLVYNKLMRAKRALYEGSVGKVSPSDEQKLLRRKAEIERILQDTLPSLSDCNSKDNSKTDELAHYLIQHDKKYGAIKKELKNINRILDPENPSAGNLDYLWRK